MTGSERTDEEIVGEVLRGNRETFAELIERNKTKVFNLGLRFFRNQEDAYDFTQEVFIRAYERLATFRGEAKFSTWLLRVAYFLGISSSRRQRKQASLPEDFDPQDPGLNPEQLHLAKAASKAVTEAVKDLPERYRICLDMYFAMRMTYEEIAEVTGIPGGTVKSHVFRAKTQLRKDLQGTAAEGYYEV